MDKLDLARWQFAITTIYHFLFVPISIGMSGLVAILQTLWVRTKKDEYLKATKFWGKLFLINFAMGIVTGIVQEFQFGMNWSEYSRYVGDVFGAPLAIEGLLAFFLESTFIGLWIFGWDRLPQRIHLSTIWIAFIGTTISAYVILAANSWMQHPVGFHVNKDSGRAEMNDFWAIMTSDVTILTTAHALAACFVTSATLMLVIALWHLRRGHQTEIFRPSSRIAAWALLISALAVIGTGDFLGRTMTRRQPMKMAAVEALYETTNSAPLSFITITSADGKQERFSLRIPMMLSILSTGDPHGKVEGINDLQEIAVVEHGKGNYIPYVPSLFWSFRIMVGIGFIMSLLAIAVLWLTRTKDSPINRWLWRAAFVALWAPWLANSLGWILREYGRQPWAVYGILRTSTSVSPSVSFREVLTSLIIFTIIYGFLAIIEISLLVRLAKGGALHLPEHSDHDEADNESLTIEY